MTGTALQVTQQRELARLISQIEKLNEEVKELADETKATFAEAKGKGYCTKTMRKIIALRKLSPADREEAEALLAVYAHAIGFETTPLGQAAERPLLAVV